MKDYTDYLEKLVEEYKSKAVYHKKQAKKWLIISIIAFIIFVVTLFIPL